MERHDDRQDLTEGQVALAGTVTLAVLEEVPEIQGGQPLAKIVDSAEHGAELAQRDLRVLQADW